MHLSSESLSWNPQTALCIKLSAPSLIKRKTEKSLKVQQQKSPINCGSHSREDIIETFKMLPGRKTPVSDEWSERNRIKTVSAQQIIMNINKPQLCQTLREKHMPKRWQNSSLVVNTCSSFSLFICSADFHGPPVWGTGNTAVIAPSYSFLNVLNEDALLFNGKSV